MMRDTNALLSPRSSLVPEEWKRAPRPLLERRWFDSTGEGPELGTVASVRLSATLPTGTTAGNVSFSVTRGAGGGIGLDGPTMDSYERFRRLLPAEGGLLSVAQGAVLHEPLSVDVSLPLQVGGSVGSALRITLGEGAKAKVLLRFRVGDSGSKNGVLQDSVAQEATLFLSRLELDLGAGSELELSIISSLWGSVRRLDRTSALLGKGASLRVTEAGFDRGNGRYETSIVLEGEGSKSDFAGAYAASGRTDQERLLNETHRGVGTVSRATLKSVLKDEARLVFRGLIEVTPEAPGTDAYLSNRNLLLNDGARAESLPQLKIDQDDVACSHGSTTGGPSEDELFYLQTRGLSLQDARELLSIGHLGSVLGRMGGSMAEESEAVEEAERLAVDLLIREGSKP